ncbi:L-rhamnose-binding lectin CSL3-like [Rhopilema esculentum]|uniref:L-rhamnose-binding lectin CSL3-like n=1 Tax=Rhopilema esculentum TaxID=499914 RepID=UPI0031CE2315
MTSSTGEKANDWLMLDLSTARRRSIACEGGVAKLVCPLRQKLKILQANYGRSNRSYCRRHNFLNTRCRASRSLSIVRKRCDRKRSCAVPATNRVFGDPCGGTFKYLDITYQCA